MVIAAFQPGEKYAINFTTLDQYDYGQVLRIQGLKLPKTVEVHFSTQETGGTSIARVGVTKDGVTDVLIPDSVLENGDTTQNYSIFAFVYVTDATSGKTEYRAKLEVKARPKPEVPGDEDNPDIFHEAVLEVRKSAEKAEEAQRQADEDAKKTTEDRKTVEDAVESVKDITEQVARVEELSRNAQEAATQTQNAAQGIITDRKQIQKNTTEISAIKKGIPSKLSELQEDNMHRTVTDAEKENWNAKSDFSGNYNDLENKPDIPTVPDALPNPHALVFRGAVSGTYDGSEEKTIEIPAGGGGTNIDDADLKLLIDYTLPSELAEAVSIDFTEQEYPGISNLKLIYIVVFMPGANSNSKWWAVRTAQDNGPYMDVINFDVSLQKMAGLAKVINKRWWQGVNAQSNANVVSVSWPKLLYKVEKIEDVIDDNIFERNQEFKPFNKINLYSYGKFLMEGTRILIYGAK